MKESPTKRVVLWLLSRLSFAAVAVGIVWTIFGLPGKTAGDPITAWSGFGVTLASALIFLATQRMRHAGLRTGGLQLIILVLLTFTCTSVLVPVYQGARPMPKATVCISNLKSLAMGNAMYATDFDERMPPAARWQTLTDPYRRGFLKCPDSKAPVTYAFNDAASALGDDQVRNPKAVMLFEMDSERKNAHGGAGQMVIRHELPVYAAMDGSAKKLDAKLLAWDTTQ